MPPGRSPRRAAPARPSRRIGILTGGGDCPGLNAVIRAVVKTAQNVHGWEVWGVRDGFEGFLRPRGSGLVRVTREEIAGLLPRGGTILGASNRCNIFAVRRGTGAPRDLSERVPKLLRARGIEGLVVVGGDGTHRQALELFERWKVPLVGVPKTIDNDVSGTDATFGFDTAVGIVAEAVDRLHTTAESHHRVMCVEVMGRRAGWIALHGGMAGGADVILIPEIPYDPDRIARRAARRAAHGRRFSLVVVAEGARTMDGRMTYRQGTGQDPLLDRLGGVSYRVADELRQRGVGEVRNIVLGHVQRGGTPSPFDRVLATRMGVAAVGMLQRGEYGRMVALKGTRITSVDVRSATRRRRRVSPRGELVRSARELGISFAAADGSDDRLADLRDAHGAP